MAPATTTGPDLTGIAPDEVDDEYRRRGVDGWTDRALVAAAGRALAPPRAAPANSFVLHAPLELLARAALLARVAPAARTQARVRIVGLAAAYEAAGDPVEPPGATEVGSLDDGARDLVAAIGAGELDDVDRLATGFAAGATPPDLARLLGEALSPSLAAAGHAPILLFQFPRIATAADVTVEILRGAAREIARHPDWRIRWHDAAKPDRDNATAAPALLDALLSTPPLGLPGSDFIFPLMHQVESAGVAASVLSAAIDGPIAVDAARRDLARVAAYSMLQEPPTYAPYGWTHCLTMPQAAIGLAGHGVAPRTALAVAGTFTAGFRAGLGTVTIDPEWQPDRATTSDIGEAISAGTATAAATVWHAPDADLASITTELVTRAALHHDAHVVKYTLACLDAADDDPPARRLYLAAAAALLAWWRATG